MVKVNALSSANFQRMRTIDELRDEVRKLEDLGVNGCLVGDHLFTGQGGSRRDPANFTDSVFDVLESDTGGLYPGFDPLTFLSAVGTLSDRLAVGTIVANVGFGHPALVLRQFAQLATFFGGDRVIAGIGAGWNGEEFTALGKGAMPPLADRLQHLRGAARLAREWFDTGISTFSCATFEVDQLPMTPVPEVPPRLMVGGGSGELLSIAGQYADQIDLEVLARKRAKEVTRESGRSGTATTGFASHALAAVADLEAAVAVVEGVARDAGRDPARIGRSLGMLVVEFCDGAHAAAREEEICRSFGLDPFDLSQSPYILVGDPIRMQDLLAERIERIGLDSFHMPAGPNLERFMTEVAPYL